MSLAASAATSRISRQHDPVLQIIAGVRHELLRGPPRLCQASDHEEIAKTDICTSSALHCVENIGLAHSYRDGSQSKETLDQGVWCLARAGDSADRFRPDHNQEELTKEDHELLQLQLIFKEDKFCK
ncbi:uncharacterized protein BBA_05102 [Beauveria bassiana ARSEF 2860]|uniref:Uncharacterized protein n=1 Tax=Beauveria bassiana (strain ARSEF 2860) TaxID=655819 RepID=J5JUC6_BEAB2|nr:uncharacterized protein BBA_05102 [Beauveria bassiana ARSEF 2860]EJP66131.1 hypothetical protein BBA_05102 [Beauveria bassiana ARSEF 2860]